MMWITFKDGKKGVRVKAATAEEAMRIAHEKTGREPLKAERTPYPFCHTPEKCAGRGYCPHEYACSE